MRKGKKIAVAMLMLILASGSVIGGTVAWLIAESKPVVNTFTYGDINIKLDETDLDENGEPVKDADGNPVRTEDGNDYTMIPGNTIAKDPMVTVMAGNEACWLFVKLEKAGSATVDGMAYGFDDFLEYSVAEGWNQLTVDGAAVEGVFYREVGKDMDGDAVAYSVLAEDKVTVKGTVSKEMLNALESSAGGVKPQLTITAYAVQRDNIESAADAWAEIGE